MKLQITSLHSGFDTLQQLYGDKSLLSIYGAGCVRSPEIMFIFMNPTGRNISSTNGWNGIRAPWIGTKNIWDLFHHLRLIGSDTLRDVKKRKPLEWTPQVAFQIYKELAQNRVYLTNLAKCTQIDARPLSNIVFQKYRPLMFQEIQRVKPKRIVTFGNQVSTVLLGKQVSVSQYLRDEKEILSISEVEYQIYPTYYPVGQGRRNMPLAEKRIEHLLSKKEKA